MQKTLVKTLLITACVVQGFSVAAYAEKRGAHEGRDTLSRKPKEDIKAFVKERCKPRMLLIRGKPAYPATCVKKAVDEYKKQHKQHNK